MKLKSFYKERVRIESYDQPPPGINPKTFKLDRALGGVRSTFFIVLDDDTILPPTTLEALVRLLEFSDLATALPGYLMVGGVPSRLLSSFVNNNAVATYLTLLPFKNPITINRMCVALRTADPFINPITINGMCYALRTDDFRRIGGFSLITDHLTDDLAVAQLIKQNGGRIFQSFSPVFVSTHVTSFKQYFKQMHRWFVFALLLVKTQPAGVSLTIGLLNSLHPIILWAIALIVIYQKSGLWILGLLLFLRAFVIVSLNRKVGNCQWHAPLSSIVSELLQPLHLAHATLVKTITWRKRRYRVISNSEFIEAK
jgi:ceramide glucosyltransferase